jgi:hypothetical protein
MKRYESAYNKVIRIRKEQLEWITSNFPQYHTAAGKLDAIINSYRQIVDLSNGTIKRKTKYKKIQKGKPAKR